VAVLDADQEGFLRSRTSLIQTVGRAARHEKGKAILYADRITDSMKSAMDEMDRRREVQRAYNTEHGITPTSIVKSIEEVRFSTRFADAREDPVPRAEPLSAIAKAGGSWADASEAERAKILETLDQEMRAAADDLDFELAAQIRDQIMDLKAAGSGARGHRGTGKTARAPMGGGRGKRARR
jgi:excinuclease ABC subunit B